MLLARVVGTVVATRKDPRLVSNKLLIARPMDPHGKPEGNYLVAVDTVDAGVGETVLIVSGSSARMAAGMKDCPVDAAIVGIVDTVEVDRRRLTPASPTMQLARVIGDVVVDPEGREPHRRDAARPAAAGGRRRPTSAGRWSRWTRWAPASARPCSSCAARKPAFRSIRPRCPPTPASSASWTTGTSEEPDQCSSRESSAPSWPRRSTAKFEGAKLLLVQPVDVDDEPRGATLLAVDSVGAGVTEQRADRDRRARRRRGAGPQGRAGRRGHHRHRRSAWTCTNDRTGTARAGARRDRAPWAAGAGRTAPGRRRRPCPCAVAACPRATRCSSLPAGMDTDGPCMIEPAVACNHCGYCKSYGH